MLLNRRKGQCNEMGDDLVEVVCCLKFWILKLELGVLDSVFKSTRSQCVFVCKGGVTLLSITVSSAVVWWCWHQNILILLWDIFILSDTALFAALQKLDIVKNWPSIVNHLSVEEACCLLWSWNTILLLKYGHLASSRPVKWMYFYRAEH